MARRWTKKEESVYRKELLELYVRKNLCISEISRILKISESSVFQRLNRLEIATIPQKKARYCNRRDDITIPLKYSPSLAEFFGIMLGDGHISQFQVIVTLGNKECLYVKHVQNLIASLFGPTPKISTRKQSSNPKKYHDVYVGSTELSSWLRTQGLVSNKVKDQVKVPKWILSKEEYIKGFLRGFFDTDGSIYKLKFGVQISFCNRSVNILNSLQIMLKNLKYNPSSISGFNIYLTKRKDIDKFFSDIVPKNPKHTARYKLFNNA